jgi:hypothetical protein
VFVARVQLIFLNLLVSVVCQLYESTEYIREVAQRRPITSFEFWIK